jgi:hypothetical protein
MDRHATFLGGMPSFRRGAAFPNSADRASADGRRCAARVNSTLHARVTRSCAARDGTSSLRPEVRVERMVSGAPKSPGREYVPGLLQVAAILERSHGLASTEIAPLVKS